MDYKVKNLQLPSFVESSESIWYNSEIAIAKINQCYGNRNQRTNS